MNHGTNLTLAAILMCCVCAPAAAAYKCVVDCQPAANGTSYAQNCYSGISCNSLGFNQYLSANTWSVTFSEGTYTGISRCSAMVGSVQRDAPSDSCAPISNCQSGGTYYSASLLCWCHLIGTTASCSLGSRAWVSVGYVISDSGGDCARDCAYQCAYATHGNPGLRNALFYNSDLL
ncbi:MAG: hypothetical protein LBD50_03500 [Rickettsiales bacterium]|jgi:hypothetical protein|nr:hypothetical protein [Rickettsiales bacterium]